MKGTPKQFDSAGETQIWKDVCFWLFLSQFVCPMPLINRNFLSILFVALSHCDKQKFSLLHWITATIKKMFVALSHCDKQSLYMLPKFAKSVNNTQVFGTVDLFFAIFGTFMPYFVFFEDICCCFLELFGNIYRFCLSQWLTATNKNSVCCSGSVPQTKILFVAVTQCDKQ